MIIAGKHVGKIPLWAYLLLLVVYFVIAIYIDARLNIPIDGLGTRTVDGKSIVSTVKAGSPAEKAGIQVGDTLVRIGPSAINVAGHMEMLEKYRPGDRLPYQVERNGKVLIVYLTLKPLWSIHTWFYFAFYALIIMVCTSSLLLFYWKPYDPAIRVFFVFLQLFAMAQNLRFLHVDTTYSLIATVAFIFSFNLFGVVLLHFHLIFPQTKSFYKNYKILVVAAYALGILFSLVLTFLFVRQAYVGTQASISSFDTFSRWSIIWMGMTLSLAFVAAFYQFKATSGKRTRKQLRLVIIGSAFGLVTPILYSIFAENIVQLEEQRHMLSALEFTNGVGTYIMTAFLAIAIFRFRMWNIEPVFYKAILYACLTLVVYFSYIILVSLIGKYMATQSNFAQFLILSGSFMSFLLTRDFIKKNVDRVFYRESYDSARVVQDFEDKLDGIYDIEELTVKISDFLSGIFHSRSFVMLIQTSKMFYKVIFQIGIDDSIKDNEYEITTEVNDMLLKSRVFSTEEMWIKPGIIEYCNAELVVPMGNDSQIFGFFLVGSKRSEKSYSLQDIRILSILARRSVSLFHTAMLYKEDLDNKLMLERERNRIARDMHDDVGASLTRISILSSLVKNKDSSPEVKEQWLDQISQISSDVVQEMNQIIWTLNNKSDTLEGLISYIRRFSIEFLESSATNCNFTQPEELPGKTVSIEARRNIFLVVKEALNNAVKHSNAKNISISVSVNTKNLILSLKDDGIGFDPENTKLNGNGLVNMKRRMKDIHSELFVSSKIGEGTKISLITPLNGINL